MNAFQWLETPTVDALGTSLLHFLWQGTVILIVAAVGLRILGSGTSRTRYSIWTAALFAMSCCVPIHYAWLIHTTEAQGTSPTSDESGLAMADAESSRLASADARLATPVEETAAAELRMGQVSRPSQTNRSLAPAGADDPTRPAAAAGSSEFTERLMPFVVAGYLLGSVCMLLRLLWAVAAAHVLRRTADPIKDSRLLEICAASCRQLGLKTQPVLAWSARVASPVVVGVLRPALLLPMQVLTQLDETQLRAVMTHELGHIRRLDPIVNLIQRVVEAVLFFHPAVWYVSRQISRERENQCDDLVLAAGFDPGRYAASLVQISEWRQRMRMSNQPSTVLAAAADRPSRLRTRVLRVLAADLEPASNRFGQTSMLALLAVISLMFSPLAVTARLSAGDQQTDATKAPPTPAPSTPVPSTPATAESPFPPSAQPAEAAPGTPRRRGSNTDANSQPDSAADNETLEQPSETESPQRQGLEFLDQYPALAGLQLDMTEKQLQAQMAAGKFKAVPVQDGDSKTYSIATGDGHVVLVMFRGQKCTGIQRLRGDLPAPEANFAVDVLIDQSRDGNEPGIWMRGHRLTRDEFAKAIQAHVKQHPNAEVKLRVHNDVLYEHVVALIDASAAAGVNKFSMAAVNKLAMFDCGLKSADAAIVGGTLTDDTPELPADTIYSVRLTHDAWRTHSGELPNIQVVRGGRFEFRGVPPGKFELSVVRIVNGVDAAQTAPTMTLKPRGVAEFSIRYEARKQQPNAPPQIKIVAEKRLEPVRR